MSDAPTLYSATVGLFTDLLEPLAAAADDRSRRRELLAAIGANLDEGQLTGLDQRFADLKDAYQGIVDLAGTTDPSLADLTTALGVVGDLFDGLQGIDDDLSGVAVDDVAGALVEHLVLRYLFTERPELLQALMLLTVVQRPDTDTNEGLLSYPAVLPPGTSFDAERVGTLLSDPTTVADAYIPSAVTDPDAVRQVEGLVFPVLTALFGALGFRIARGDTPLEISDFGGVQGLDVASRSLTVHRELGPTTTVGATFVLGTTGDGLCLVVAPIGTLSLDESVGEWTVSLTASGDFDVVVLNTDGVVHADPDSGRVSGSGSVSAAGSSDGGPAFVLGPAEGTRMELGSVGVRGDLTATGDGVEVDALASASDSTLAVAPAGDGFVTTVLPEDGVDVGFDAGVGWASGRGIYFEGGAGLDTDLPVNVSIADVLTVRTIHLAAAPAPGEESVTVPVELSANPQVQLGPVGATVERLGLEAEVSFPERRDGNLGLLDIDIGLKPPSGAGISVDASAVVGGGYLSFDPENERYSGTLQLQIGSLTLKAVGLLTTRFPDGRDGFSLLVIITGEFPPVQLGFGFTLNGLGGLLGINRGTKVEALRAGLRDGTTKSILFPRDPMRNAPRIVSDLRRVFPPTRARHVFGPMAKLGWGTPTMMTAELGVLVSLPAPIKLVLLGRLHAALPDDEAALVVFNMDAIGVVDFGAKEASIDATLYDSRVGAYTLTGDMAMRTNWGADPDFALSVGGFHPTFDPPEGFPELRRIALTLGPGNPRIRWSGYFAITSNTVQAGAKVELYAAAAGFAVSGHLGFDALFQFDPFKLLVDIAAGFAIKRGGTTLLSAQLRGSLKGPNPWHVRGNASFEIWPLSFSVTVDATFGERRDPEPLPPADVLGQVTAALGDERNWSAQRPENGESAVTLREIERESGTVLAHPLGTLAVRQQIAPLGITIETFGNATPATYTKYTISSVHVAGQSQSVDGTDSREQFAPAQFFELTDDEKLQRPSFERYPAGTTVGNTLFAHGGMEPGDDDQVRTAELVYETSLVDEQVSPFSIDWKRLAMPTATAAALTEVSAVARGPLRTTGTAKFAGTDDASGPTGVDATVSVSDTTYVVARRSDLRQVAVPDVPSDGTTRRETAEALDAFVAASDRDAGAYRVVASHEAAGPEVSP